jgi:hypothetical protein
MLSTVSSASHHSMLHLFRDLDVFLTPVHQKHALEKNGLTGLSKPWARLNLSGGMPTNLKLQELEKGQLRSIGNKTSQ